MELIKKCLLSDNAELGEFARNILDELLGKKDLEYIMDCLNEKIPKFIVVAIKALEKFPEERSYLKLMDLKNSSDNDIAKAAEKTLSKMGQGGFSTFLKSLFK